MLRGNLDSEAQQLSLHHSSHKSNKFRQAKLLQVQGGYITIEHTNVDSHLELRQFSLFVDGV